MVWSIFSTMDENDKSLLYFGVIKHAGAKRRRWEKYALPLYRCGRKGKMRDGRLFFFYTPVPEYYLSRNNPKPEKDMMLVEERRQESICYKIGKVPGDGSKWKAEKLRNYMQEALEVIRPDHYFIHPELWKMLDGSEESLRIPLPLREAMLYEGGSLKNVDILLPDEGRAQTTDILIELLTPFLPRMNLITLIGGEDFLAEELEEYFFEEYGIVTGRAKRPGKDTYVLNLKSGEREAVKFLDTMLKNGYNTKVN